MHSNYKQREKEGCCGCDDACARRASPLPSALWPRLGARGRARWSLTAVRSLSCSPALGRCSWWETWSPRDATRDHRATPRTRYHRKRSWAASVMTWSGEQGLMLS